MNSSRKTAHVLSPKGVKGLPDGEILRNRPLPCKLTCLCCRRKISHLLRVFGVSVLSLPRALFRVRAHREQEQVMREKKIKVAIIGSGNIGTDLMIKVMRTSDVLEMGAFVGIDPESDGLKRAARLGVATTHDGIEGLTRMAVWPEIGIVFDATSAGAHKKNSEIC